VARLEVALIEVQLTQPGAFYTGAWTRPAGLVPGGGMISRLPLSLVCGDRSRASLIEVLSPDAVD